MSVEGENNERLVFANSESSKVASCDGAGCHNE